MTVNTHRKGSRWRREVQHWLDAAGARTRFRSIGDTGDDITAVFGDIAVSIEAKNCKAISLAMFVDQAVGNAPPGQIPAVVIKRRGHPSPEQAYVVLPGWAFIDLIKEQKQ